MGGDAALGAALCLQFNTTLRRLPLLHPRPSPSSPPLVVLHLWVPCTCWGTAPHLLSPPSPS